MNHSLTIASAFALLCGIALGFLLASFGRRRDEGALAGLAKETELTARSNADLKEALARKEEAIEALRTELEAARQGRAVADSRLSEAERYIAAQKSLLDTADQKLSTTFKALAGESLKSNNQEFLILARQSLEKVLSEAKGEIARKEESIDGIVKPLKEALARYEQQIGKLEQSHHTVHASLETQIRQLMSSETRLQQETGNLVAALRRPEVRGRWGEVTLKRVVELAGMSDHCDYTEQVSVSTGDGRLRPDMVVHLPNERDIVIDSKVSLDAYLDAIACQDPEKRSALILRHSQQIKRHMRQLAEKNYWEQFPKAPEFVVMFIPGESFLAAALDIDNTLIEEGMQSRVIIATPTTLIALLRAIAFGWRQEQLTANAQKIATLGKEIYDRFQPFLEHVNKVGLNLTQASDAFNKMVRSLETRVMVSVRKFKELGAAGDKDLPELEEIDRIPSQAAEHEPSAAPDKQQ